MRLNGKQRAINKANKLLENRYINGHIINESHGHRIGTPIVTFKNKIKGNIVDVQYVVKLDNGETTILKEGDFYDDTDPDLPF